METTEGNRLIAEFVPEMAWIVPANASVAPYWRKVDESGLPRAEYPPEKLKYHTSWDWLMPVIERIETMHHIDKEGDWGNYDFSMHRTYTSFGFGRFRIGGLHKGSSRLESTYAAVIAFIQWYNAQPK